MCVPLGSLVQTGAAGSETALLVRVIKRQEGIGAKTLYDGAQVIHPSVQSVLKSDLFHFIVLKCAVNMNINVTSH